MRIAVNTRSLLPGYPEEYGYFLYETFRLITKNHPEHEFIFIFDRPWHPQFIFAPNVKPVLTGPATRHPLVSKIWYDIRVPALLKKVKADVFISADGTCSLTTRVPQCLVVPNLAFLHYPSFYKKSHLLFYKRYVPKWLAKAQLVATLSEFTKKDILAHYKTDAGKIDTVFSAPRKIFCPVSREEKEVVKNKYTNGKEYFVYAGCIHPQKNLVNLLKAFSVFKKRQQTNLKLVLAGRLAREYPSFTKSLTTYKYKNDVVMTGWLEEGELVKVMGSAYGLIDLSLFDESVRSVLEAMRCEVPVITSMNSAMQEIAGDAALLANVDDHTDIAEKMMRLYKDENGRNELIRKGIQVVRQYSWDKTAELLWQSIQKAARGNIIPY
jgi:glycosyltransferase involved in cell wall biosynthesis